MKIKLPLVVMLTFLFSIACFSQTYIYVSPTGSDSNDGSEASPLATLRAAQTKARALGPQEGGITVYLRGGTYEVRNSLQLTNKDSGAPGRPFTIAAFPGEAVIFDGGESIPTDGFVLANDNSILHNDAAGKVYVKDFSTSSLKTKLGSTTTVLAADGKMMSVARFPNRGYAQVVRASVSGETVKGDGTIVSPKGPQFKLYESPNYSKWNAEFARIKKVVAKGYMSAPWHVEEHPFAQMGADGTLRLTDGTSYGMAKQTIIRVSVQNMLCELDAPGEWYFDNTTGKMYIWPYDDNLASTSLRFWGGDEVFSIESGEYINIQNFTIQNLGGQQNGKGAISIQGYSKHCQVAGVTFRNIANPMTAINITGAAKDCGVISSNFYDISNCSRLYGGSVSANAIEYGNNYIENCHFTQMYSKDFYGKSCGISGAGNIFRNNLIHNMNGQTVTYSGAEHTIELNEVFNSGVEEGDGGCFYTGANLTSFENLVQYNFVHHIMRVPKLIGRAAFFSDDFDAGEVYRGNITYKGGSESIKMNKGGGHRVIDNIVLDTYVAVNQMEGASRYAQQMTYVASQPFSTDKDNAIGRMLQLIGEPGWNEGLTEDNWDKRISQFWFDRYPTFKEMIEGYQKNNSFAPYGGQYKGNRFYSNSYNIKGGSVGVKSDNKDIALSVFNDPSVLDFSYKGAQPADMPVIPFNNIGLYVDQFRRQMPDKDVYRKAIKDHFEGKSVHTGDSYDYKTINQRLYYNTGEIVWNSIPSSGATAPIVKFLAPTNGAEYLQGDDIEVAIDASDEGSVAKVALYINDTLISELTSAPYEWKGAAGIAKLANMSIGEYVIKAIAIDNDGNESNVWNRLQVNDPSAVVELVNVAVGKTASQSSNHYGDVDRGEADDVCDGIVEGVYLADSSWNSTAKEYQAWVQVDLEGHYDIHSINIWNRINAGSRMTNFYVLVSDYPFTSNSLNSALKDSKVSAYYYSSTCKRPTTFEVGTTGQYVRLQLVGTNLLHAAEIEVNVLPGNENPVSNVAPKAMISNDRFINENDTITLDGSESFDFEGSSLTYEWIVPEGVKIINPTSAKPQIITPDVDAEVNLELSLIVNDGERSSAPYTKIFKVLPNAKPVVKIGKDQIVQEQQLVVLDASFSEDPEGVQLMYQWFLPEAFVVADDSQAKLTFTAPIVDSVMVYHCKVEVSDGENVVSDSLSITVLYNTPPVAVAGPDQVVTKGSLFILDGSASSDKEKADLVYTWNSLNKTALAGDDSEYPYGTAPSDPDTTNVYEFTLVVSDGLKTSAPDTVAISVSDLEIISSITAHNDFNFSVYPNPAIRNHAICITLPTAAAYTISVYDLSGKVVLKRSVEGNDKPTLQLQQSGSYLIYITDKQQLQSISKLIVL